MADQKKLRSQFYKWHRIIGLIALIPVISWTVSGLSHPFMSNWFRPFLPKESYQSPTIDKLKPARSLKQVLEQNQVEKLRNYGIISLNGKTFYQVLGIDSLYRYYSATDGTELPDGDRQYALYLARYFTQDSTSKISNTTLQKSFDAHYQPINRLLPVWKISFDRPDGMEVYVETGQGRMGTFNNNTRKAMLVFFQQLHTWQWLADLAGDQVRLVVLLIVTTAMFLAMLSGLIVYGLFWKRFKEIAQKQKANGNADKGFIHRFHRQLGIIVSLVMFAFLFSAGFHIAVKMKRDQPVAENFKQEIDTKLFVANNLKLPIADTATKNQGLISFNNRVYYQVVTKKKALVYVDAATGKVLHKGDEQFARYLAGYYSGRSATEAPVKAITHFTEEYGFINKRLPVQQIAYQGGDNWYIETSTAKVATHVAGLDRAEGFSFIFLHKHFGMAWAGKDVRDIVTMLSALGILVVSLFGFAAFLKNK